MGLQRGRAAVAGGVEVSVFVTLDVCTYRHKHASMIGRMFNLLLNRVRGKHRALCQTVAAARRLAPR